MLNCDTALVSLTSVTILELDNSILESELRIRKSMPKPVPVKGFSFVYLFML